MANAVPRQGASMGISALGVLLSKLREKRGLNLRELGTLSKVDHSYIYKLEVGDKLAPSDEVLAQLFRTLKPNQREKQIADFVLAHPSASPELVAYTLENDSVAPAWFELATVTAHRGTGRPDPRTLIERARVAHEAMEKMQNE